jgi:hypothetical protein
MNPVTTRRHNAEDYTFVVTTVGTSNQSSLDKILRLFKEERIPSKE